MIAKKKLGHTGLEITPFVLGGNVFGWTAGEPTSFKIVDRFLDFGGDLVDTADVYTGFYPTGKYGESERVIGNWMKSRKNRERVLVATKVGYEMAPDKKGLSRKYIFQAVEDSLQRLQTDYIDLYQSHRDDLETPTEETLDAYAQLIQQGKVRFIGASQCTPERLQNSLNIAREKKLKPYQTLQPYYNLYARQDFETKFKSICEAEGLGVITYFSLARGFLTGKYRTEGDLAKSERGSTGVKDFMNVRGFRILDALDAVSKAQSTTPARVSLAWIMAQAAVTAPIASATQVEQLDDLLQALELKLTPESLALLDQASRID